MCSTSKTENLECTKHCSLHSGSVLTENAKQKSLSLVERYNQVIVKRERQTLEAKMKKRLRLGLLRNGKVKAAGVSGYTDGALFAMGIH